MKSDLQKITMRTALGAFALLAVLSVLGVLAGAERAAALFNSPVLAVFWVGLVLFIAAGLIFFRRLHRSPGLLGMHAGVLLILVGAMYGSDRGHAFAAKILGSKKAPSGYVFIYEGDAGSSTLEREVTEEVTILPFSLKLNDFSVEYYDAPEAAGDASADVAVTDADRKGHSPAKTLPQVRDYKSDISVIDGGVEVARKTVEVNHPLHYGGYHFYQYSYDSKQGKYTVLLATSDSGLGLVYAGFALLCFGACYGCWVEPAVEWVKRRKGNGG